MRSQVHRAPERAGAILLCVLTIVPTTAQAAPLALAEARQRALASLPAVEAARERAAAYRLRRAFAGRMANPTVAIGVENFGLGLGGDRRETTVELGQKFELGGDRAARSAVAGAATELADADHRAIEQATLEEVDERFIAAWSLQEKVAIQRSFVELAERSRRLAEARHRAGAAPRGEVLRAAAEQALREAEHRRAGADRRVALQQLQSLVGTETLVDSLVLESATAAPRSSDTVATDLARLPEQEQAEAAARLAEAEARLARASRTPDLELGIGVRRLEETGGTGVILGVATTLPFWNPGRGEVAAADADQRAAGLRARGRARSLEAEFAGMRGRLAAALDYERALREEVRPAIASALEQIEAAYRAGRVSGLESVEAQRALWEVDLTVVDARSEVARTRAELSRWHDSARQGALRPEEGR